MSDQDDVLEFERISDIESAVIGACFLDPKAATLALEHLQPQHFAEPKAQRAFRAIQRNTPENGVADLPLTIADLNSDPSNNGTAKWTTHALATPTAANQALYVARVLRDFLEREERDAAKALADAEHAAQKLEATRRLSDVEALRQKLRAPLGIGPTVTPFAPVGAYDLLQTALPMVEELVRPRVIYRGGVTVLVASHKRGKSLAALGLCADLVLNICLPFDAPQDACPRWLGQEVFGRGPVLVYSAEGGERMIQDRLRKIVPRAGAELNDLKVYAKKPTPQLDNMADLDAVFAQAEAMNAVLLVFDPLGRFWAMEDEADPTTARNLMEAIQVRAEAAYEGRGIAVLVIHHDTKSSGADADSAVTGGRGSGKFGDDADALINLKLVKGGMPGESEAKFLLRHAESPSPVRVIIDKDTLRLREENEQDETARDAQPDTRGRRKTTTFSIDHLARIVRERGSIHSRDIAEALGVAYGTWRNNSKDFLEDFLASGEFQRVDSPDSKGFRLLPVTK